MSTLNSFRSALHNAVPYVGAYAPLQMGVHDLDARYSALITADIEDDMAIRAIDINNRRLRDTADSTWLLYWGDSSMLFINGQYINGASRLYATEGFYGGDYFAPLPAAFPYGISMDGSGSANIENISHIGVYNVEASNSIWSMYGVYGGTIASPQPLASPLGLRVANSYAITGDGSGSYGFTGFQFDDGYVSLINAGSGGLNLGLYDMTANRVFGSYLRGQLEDNSGYLAVDTASRALADTSGTAIANWSNTGITMVSGYPVNTDYINGISSPSPYIHVAGGVLTDSSSYTSANWQDRYLVDGFANTALDWQARALRDASNYDSVNWANRTLADASNNLAANWASRELVDTGNITVLDWDDMYGVYLPMGLRVGGLMLMDNHNIYDIQALRPYGSGNDCYLPASGGTMLSDASFIAGSEYLEPTGDGSSLQNVNTLNPFSYSTMVDPSSTVGYLPLGVSRADSDIANGWGTNNVPCYFHPFLMKKAFQKISVNHTAGTHPTALLELAIYNVNADGSPGTLVEKGTVSLSSTGIKTLTLASSHTLDGLFYVTVRTDTGATDWTSGGTGSLTIRGAFSGDNPICRNMVGALDPSTFTQYHGTLMYAYSSTTALPADLTGLTYLAQVANGGVWLPLLHN